MKKCLSASIALTVAALLMLTACGSKVDMPPSSTVPSDAPVSELSSSMPAEDLLPEGDDAYYQKVIANKENILAPIQELVALYKKGTIPDNPNHYPIYPDAFPPVEQLPVITQSSDFVIRFAGNPDALGSVYAAVPIGNNGQFEMHICVSEHYDDKNSATTWGTSDVFFVEVSTLQWLVQDLDLYSTSANEASSSLPSKSASTPLTTDETKTIDVVDSTGEKYTLTYAELYYRYYCKAEFSSVLAESWSQPSEISPNSLLDFFEAQANWNQTSWDSVIVYLPQQIVEDYIKMYFDVPAEHLRKANLWYLPEEKMYQIPMYSQEYPCRITNATSEGNLLTIYYEVYNNYQDDMPILRQGYVTIKIETYPNLWKYLSNTITFKATL